MGSDILLALGSACVHGQTLLGINRHGDAGQLRRVPGGAHALDERVQATHLALPQARETFAAVGRQTAGAWGFDHGLNEHQLAVAVTGWQSRLPRAATGLTGGDLVRLALQRSPSARHAVDVLTDLIGRHGQTGEPADHVFVVADPDEAYVLEAAGRYWALQTCGQTRVVTDVALTRQDWQRLAPGLADFAVRQGWWQDDGSKLDFVGCLDGRGPGHAGARRRWGRASVALAQQQGAIDLHFLRRHLGEHYESCRPLLPAEAAELADSFVTALVRGQAPLAWCALGWHPYTLYLPVSPLAELPAALGPPAHPENPTVAQCLARLPALVGAGRVEPAALTETLERLQATFDLDADELLRQAPAALPASALMARHGQLFERAWRELLGAAEPAEMTAWVDEEAVPY